MRAESSGVRLCEEDAALVKGVLERGDRHHDIAAWFGVNQGRVANVKNGDLFPDIEVAAAADLPPVGPYSSGKSVHQAVVALDAAKIALSLAMEEVDRALVEVRRRSSV